MSKPVDPLSRVVESGAGSGPVLSTAVKSGVGSGPNLLTAVESVYVPSIIEVIAGPPVRSNGAAPNARLSVVPPNVRSNGAASGAKPSSAGAKPSSAGAKPSSAGVRVAESGAGPSLAGLRVVESGAGPSLAGLSVVESGAGSHLLPSSSIGPGPDLSRMVESGAGSNDAAGGAGGKSAVPPGKVLKRKVREGFVVKVQGRLYSKNKGDITEFKELVEEYNQPGATVFLCQVFYNVPKSEQKKFKVPTQADVKGMTLKINKPVTVDNTESIDAFVKSIGRDLIFKDESIKILYILMDTKINSELDEDKSTFIIEYLTDKVDTSGWIGYSPVYESAGGSRRKNIKKIKSRSKKGTRRLKKN